MSADTPTEGPAALPAVFNFAQHLLSENAARPEKTAFIDDHGALSYGQLDERVRRVAASRVRWAYAAKSACCCWCTTAATGQ